MTPQGSPVAPSSARIVASAADALGLDFLVLDDFAPAEACDRLATLYAANADRFETNHADRFWQDRLLGHLDVLELDPEAHAGMLRAVDKARTAVRAFYRPAAPLHVDVLLLVGWPAGWAMPPHADAELEDGTPHEFAHRAFSGVLYLNDDYGGGGLYLPRHDVLITPRRGMFVSLPAGLSHLHGVTRVNAGLRTTMAFFLTFDPARADRALHPAA